MKKYAYFLILCPISVFSNATEIKQSKESRVDCLCVCECVSGQNNPPIPIWKKDIL